MNTVVLGSNGDNITNINTPVIAVNNVANGATVVVTASGHPTAGDETIMGTVGSSATSITVTLGTLADGDWNITATHTDGTNSPASATLTITIDTMAPVVTVTSPADTNPAMSKIFSAVDDDDGTTVMKWRSTLADSCPALTSFFLLPPYYTEGEDFPLVNEQASNGRYSCFYSIDLAGNIGIGRSEQISGIDRTGPTITITAGTTALAQNGVTLITVTLNEASPDIELADITVSPPGAGLLTGLTLISPTGLTVSHPTEHIYTALFTAGPNVTRVTFTVAANAFTDLAGNGNTTTTTNLFDVVDSSAGRIPLSISADKTEVTEGPDATVVFTITSPSAVTGSLVVPVTQTGEGDYLVQDITEITIPDGETEGRLTATIDDDPLDELPGTIVLTLTSAPSGYYPDPFAFAVTVTVMDDDDPIPTITIDYAGQVSGKTCAAADPAAATPPAGVCEGDAIVFTITATYEPGKELTAPRNDLDVRVGRLAAGANAGQHYGLGNNAHNYADYAGARGSALLTIPANQNTGTMTINTINGYGANNEGAYFVEIICPNGNQTDCLTDDARPYNFVQTGKGGAGGSGTRNTANPTSNCDDYLPARADGDDPSECLVRIRPVASPVLSVAANTPPAPLDSVQQGSPAVFTITGDKALTNHYNAERTALVSSSFPINIAVGESGNSILSSFTEPTMVTMAAGATTVDVSIPSQAGGDADGIISLMIDAGTRYAVGVPSAATVTVAQPETVSPSIAPLGVVNARTNRMSFSVGGTSVAGAQIRITVEDTDPATPDVVLPPFTALADGTWRTTVDISSLAPMGDDSLIFTVTADVEGRKESPGRQVTVFKDLTGPTIPTLVAINSDGDTVTRMSAGDTVTMEITADELITGLGLEDIRASGNGDDSGTLDNFMAPDPNLSETDDLRVYTVTYESASTHRGYTATIVVTAGYQDLRLNPGTARTVEIEVAGTATEPLISIADAADVAEGNDASFVITSDMAPSADLTVTLAVTGGDGFLPTTGVPTAVTIMANESTATLTVPTLVTEGDYTGTDTIADGTITVTLTDGADYDVPTNGPQIGTATVKDIPVISIDYAGQASGSGKTCPAAKSTDKFGICEGNAIVFTFTADAAPTGDLDVQYGRLATGVNAALDYGLTMPPNYVASGSPSGGPMVTIDTSGSATVIINTVNGYGAHSVGAGATAGADGAYFIEVVCLGGDQTSCLNDNTIDTYTFVQTGKGGAEGNGTRNTAEPTSNCDDFTAAGADGDDPSECLVLIRSVGDGVGGDAAPPTLSITSPANNSSVEQNHNAVFTITASSAHNIYNVDRTARVGLPISIDVNQTGDSINGAAPTMATMAVGETAVAVTITTQPGDTGTGTVSLEITSANAVGYSVGSPSAITVSVIKPVDSSTPTVDL
ncbi:MAG: Ig-like domain-containing protein, partial [Pseudohongiellaceae bacterium]